GRFHPHGLHRCAGTLPEPAARKEITMNSRIRSLTVAIVLAIAALLPNRTLAASAGDLERDSKAALQKLVQKDPAAKVLSQNAKAVLVFPSIVKAGFMFGGQIGEGTVLKNGKASGFYNSVAASYGLQAGIQVYGYALFFMDDESLSYLG